MKSFQSLTHRQLLALGSFLALLGTVSVIPWQLVAQEEKHTAHGDKTGATHVVQKESGEDKLIVGAWVPGSPNAGELTFRSDGSYQDFWRTVQSVSNGGGMPVIMPVLQHTNEHGKWTVEDNVLTLSADVQQAPLLRGSPVRRPVLAAGAAPVATPPEEGPGGQPATPPRKFKIVRLDDSFLRMIPVVNRDAGFFGPDSGALFYRRDKEKSAAQQFDPSMPDQLKQLAESAQLTPKESLALQSWFKSRHLKDMRLDSINRIVQARRDKIDFQQLFELTSDENKAITQLFELVGQYNAADGLANIGQLAADEMAAVGKLRQFKSDLKEIKKAIDDEIPNDPGNVVSEQINALYKLNGFITELGWYMDETVFNPSGQYPNGGVFY